MEKNDKNRLTVYHPPRKAEQEFLYSGRAPGMTFEQFDECVISWGRAKFGEKYIKGLWRNELLDLNGLNLDDELDKFKMEEHCDLVYNVLLISSPKYADSLVGTAKFEKVKFQLETRARFREKLFCFIETITFGEARRQLQRRGIQLMNTMREHFFQRFGAGQPEILKERETIYLEGMPDSSGLAFPPRVNMEDKLDSLETEREYLIDMCPKDKRDEYEVGKESTLTRIVLRTVPAEYDPAVKSVHDLVKFRKAGEAGAIGQLTNLEDHSRKNYSADWLPPWEELRTELINTWHHFERRRKDAGKSVKKGATPVLPILNGHDQPGPHQKRCYNCGLTGHIGSDPACKAGPTEVWKGAPASYKKRRQGGYKRKGGGRGKCGEKNTQRNSGKRKQEKDFSKIPCHNWSRGNGFCKYADACRYSHDGPKGDQDKTAGAKATKSSMPMTKKQKKVKYEKKVTIFVADDSVDDEDGGSEVADPDEDDDHLYELIRGVPTVVINCLETTDDYIPVPQYTNRESNVVVKLKPATTLVPKFTVSLPIKASCSSSSCKYLPRESKNTDEKEFDQSKRNKNKNGVRGCFNFDSDNNSENDEETGSDEKDEKLETDRFVQKGGKRVKTDRFGQKAGGKDMDLEQRALNAEKKLEKLEKLNSSMKTAIRRIVRT